MVSYMSPASVGGTIVVHATRRGVELFGVVGVVVVTCVGVCLVIGGGGSLFFFKVGGCYEDGTTEFTDVDAAEGGVLFDVEPKIQVYKSGVSLVGIGWGGYSRRSVGRRA